MILKQRTKNFKEKRKDRDFCFWYLKASIQSFKVEFVEKRMPQLIIVIMQSDEYPFGECDNTQLQTNKAMVRKRVFFHPFQKINILMRAHKIKSFICPYIIKLQQVLEQEFSLHLLFQYIPIKVQTWISNINSEFIENFKSQLLELAEYLARNNVVIDFKLKNIGMDQNYQPKYFIGLDYEVKTMIGKDLLIQKYKSQIDQIIRPYDSKTIKTSQKFKSLQQISPGNVLEKRKQAPKRENHRSEKLINSFKQTDRSPDSLKPRFPQFDPIKANESYIKLTSQSSQKNLFENFAANISVNIKIGHIDRKINQFKHMMKEIGSSSGSEEEKIMDSVFMVPKRQIMVERPISSLHKCFQGPLLQESFFKGEKMIFNLQQGAKLMTKQMRETQSESQCSQKLHQSNKNLNRVYQDKVMTTKLEACTKNEVRVNAPGKQSYIVEFERLLDDDIDSFAIGQGLVESRMFPTADDKHNQMISNQGQIKSPRFGFSSSSLEFNKQRTQSYRFNYSNMTKKRKKSIQSMANNRSQIQERADAVIGATRKLISNFRKAKLGQKNTLA